MSPRYLSLLCAAGVCSAGFSLADAAQAVIARTIVSDRTILLAQLVDVPNSTVVQSWRWTVGDTAVSATPTVTIDPGDPGRLGVYKVEITYGTSANDPAPQTVSAAVDVSAVPDISGASGVDPQFQAEMTGHRIN